MIKWSDNYIMGIEAFDNDHRRLFQLSDQILNHLQERGDDSRNRLFLVRETLTYISSYFDRHAKHEEAYMREIGYEGYALHKALHDEFKNVQMMKYQKIVERGECSKDEMLDFIGTGVGWLLEHIVTADMAIVGKGIMSHAKQLSVSEDTLEQAINFLLTSSLNIEANVKVLSRNYQGEFFGKAIHRKIIYSSNFREVTIISGIEKNFLLNVAKMMYGSEMGDETELVLSSLQAFDTHFWLSIGRRFVGNEIEITVKESSLVVSSDISEELQKLKPKTSLLFTSDLGKLFMASDY